MKTKSAGSLNGESEGEPGRTSTSSPGSGFISEMQMATGSPSRISSLSQLNSLLSLTRSCRIRRWHDPNWNSSTVH